MLDGTLRVGAADIVRSMTWTIEQVVAVAPSSQAYVVAESLADPQRWSSTGADQRAVWGRYLGTGAEPYDTVVDHVEVRWRCSCPSRRQPCKHALALLVLWVRCQVPEATASEAVERWVGTASATPRQHEPEPADRSGADPQPAPTRPSPSSARDDRMAKLREGLVELDRWLDDRMRTGLADPALARYSTWDDLAARLVDARAGALANRVRRLAGLVGAGTDWHERVLAELGVLHLLAQAGRRIGDLPDDVAASAAVACGWQVRRSDVEAGVPETDDWVVAGRSDTREDRIEVRRVWLRATGSGAWAMVLSFAAYRQSLDASLEVGTVIAADVHRYPGGAMRAIVGERHGDPRRPAVPPAATVADACETIGRAVIREPWLDRCPATVLAAPTVHDGRWVLTDHTGSLPLATTSDPLAALLAASLGSDVPVTVEWTPHGVIPLAVHLADRAIDIGPRADPSFVGTP
jgi:hypothetical protein